MDIRQRLQRIREMPREERIAEDALLTQQREEREQFALHHDGILPEDWEDYQQLTRMIDSLHETVEVDGVFRTAKFWRGVKADLPALIQRMDPDADPETVSEVARVLIPRSREIPRTNALPISDTVSSEDAALLTPSSEEIVIDGVGLGFTDHATEDGYWDRRTNVVGLDFWPNQERKFVGKSLDEPIDHLWSFTEWLTVRAVLHAANRLRTYPVLGEIEANEETGEPARKIYGASEGIRDLFAEIFPGVEVDWDAAKDLARNSNVDEITDPEALLSAYYGNVKGSLAGVGALIHAYCDLVRCERPASEEPAIPDLPDMGRPRVSREGFEDYEDRIASAYRLIGNTNKVARAFGVRAQTMHDYLTEAGLLAKGRVSRTRRRY